MIHTTTLVNAQQGKATLDKLWQWCKPRLLAEQRFTLTIESEKRNTSQNAKLHVIIGEIAKQSTWANQKWGEDVWKRLLTAAWMRATGERLIIVPALDGQGVDVVFRRTSSLTKSECSDLLEFVSAWAAHNGVRSNWLDEHD